MAGERGELREACASNRPARRIRSGNPCVVRAFMARSSGGRSRSIASWWISIAMRRSLPSSSTAGSTNGSPTTMPDELVLERLGLRIVRFKNEDVLNDLDLVLAKIRAELRLPFD
jgi:hypothetical protein